MTIYQISDKVLARVPTSIGARPRRSIAESHDIAKAEAAELAQWAGVSVVTTYWNLERSAEIQLDPNQEHLLAGKTVLDFFSVQDLKDFILA